MIVPTVPFDTSKHCACEAPRPATFTDRCLTCGGMLDGRAVDVRKLIETNLTNVEPPTRERFEQALQEIRARVELPEAKVGPEPLCADCIPDGEMTIIGAQPAKAGDERLTWSLDALAFIMGQTFKRPTVDFEVSELVRRAKELGLLGEERP